MIKIKIKATYLFILFILLLIVITPVKGYSSTDTDWIVHIKVSVPDSRAVDGTVWNHLIAGIREGATDGFDNQWDTISMVEADDPVQAIFTHGALPEDKDNDGMIDDWSCLNPETGYDNYDCSLWRDLRAFEAENVWSFAVLSPLYGGTVSLQWSFDVQPKDVEITLVDLSDMNGSIDMKISSAYSYTNNLEPGKKYGIHYFEIRMKTRGLVITPPALPDATLDTLYSQRFSAIGGLPVWSLENGELPPGMSVNPYTGEITGIPTVPGLYQFTIKAADPVTGYIRSQEYAININSIPWISALNLPDGDVEKIYSGEITVTGGSMPVTWSIAGNLPEGLTLDNRTGIISGTPIVPGIYDFTALVKDANGATYSRDYRVKILEQADEQPPAAINDLRGTYISNTSVLLRWSAPVDDSMTHTAALYDLRYIEGCQDPAELNEDIWDKAMEANGEPKPQSGSLQTYSMTYLTPDKSYCFAIKSMDSSGHVSSISNRIMVTLSRDSNATWLSEFNSSLILRKGYNLISFPLIPVPNTRDLLFGASVGEPVGLYRWYSAYPDITPPQYYLEDIVQPGLGYFLYSPEGGVSLNIYGVMLEETEYRIMLQGDWNLIGNPYGKSIQLNNILVRDKIKGESKTFMDAVKNGWIGNTVYYLGEGGYDFASFNDNPPAALEPWIGYWIYVGNKEGIDIIFRRP